LARQRLERLAQRSAPGSEPAMRKLIDFDEETLDKLTQLGRDRMATLQELADEAFADVLKKHGVPIDLKDALRKSAKAGNGKGAEPATGRAAKPKTSAAKPRRTRHDDRRPV
jgi:hypothetical protein